MPKVSIVLPVHNGARFIQQAIASVQAQDFSDWECIVADDGSTDATRTIVESCMAGDARIRYVANGANLGIQKTLNKGLAAAQGQYVARIDDDDRWRDADKLSREVTFLDAHPDYALVGTGAVVVDEQGKELSRFLNPETDAQIRSRILGKNCFTHSSVLLRKDAVTKLGGYSESRETRYAEDYDLWLRMGTRHKFANLPVYATAWMIRASAIGSMNKLEQFRNDIRVSAKYRASYPRFAAGILRNWTRFLLYGMFSAIPFLRLKYVLMRTYARLFKRAL